MATVTPTVVTKTVTLAGAAQPVGPVELVITFPGGIQHRQIQTVPAGGVLPTVTVTNAPSGNFTAATYTTAGVLLSTSNFTVV